MRSVRLLPVLALVSTLLLASASTSPPVSAACAFHLGFADLASLIPEIVGGCTSDEVHNPDNGDGLQTTANGLLVWRKADNWTAFTDGATSWINGPCGLQLRPNDWRFAWEEGADCASTALVRPLPEPAATLTPREPLPRPTSQPLPVAQPTAPPPPPPTATTAPAAQPVTAICRDGTVSYSQHASGTCSSHGGVQTWVNHPPN